MSRLVDHLALARKKIIKSRKQGLSFDPKRMVKIPSLVRAIEWKGETFKDFQKKVNQAKVVIFTVLLGVDDPDNPNTLVMTSLWGEVLVTRVRDLVGQDVGHDMEGKEELRSFFRQPQTAYVTEREDKAMRWLESLGIEPDGATMTGLETWHALGQEFSPSVAHVFKELWGRITSPFRGTSSSGWAWNQHSKEESSELAPDQARLAFAIGNAMASLTLDGIAARIDPEDGRPLEELGALILRSEQEGILEAEETLGLRALRLGNGEDGDEANGAEETLKVSWGNIQTAYQEPFGRIQRAGNEPIPEEQKVSVLHRQREVFNDLVSWEEAISFVTLLGPEHKRPIQVEECVLPEAPARGILRNSDPDNVRRANDRLGLDPDDLDYARERFAGLKVTEDVKHQRTRSPPPAPNRDRHGLWEEEKHRQDGGRHRGPPRLRWNPPVKRETDHKRRRDPERRVTSQEGQGDEVELQQERAPPTKKPREERGEDQDADEWGEYQNGTGGISGPPDPEGEPRGGEIIGRDTPEERGEPDEDEFSVGGLIDLEDVLEEVEGGGVA